MQRCVPIRVRLIDVGAVPQKYAHIVWLVGHHRKVQSATPVPTVADLANCHFLACKKQIETLRGAGRRQVQQAVASFFVHISLSDVIDDQRKDAFE